MQIPRRRHIKLFILEFLQWAAFATPVFVTGAELGQILDRRGFTFYWLVVSISIGYVAASTLLVWIPVKLLFQWYKKVDFYNDEWCQSTCLYFLLSVIPCVAMAMDGSRFDKGDFQYATVELITIMLALIGILEKMKSYKLLANRQQYEAERNEAVAIDTNNETGQMRTTDSYNIYGGKTGTGRNMIPLTSTKKMIKGYLSWVDLRPIELMEFLLSVYDIRMEFYLVQHTIENGWMYAIYMIGLIAVIPLIFTKYSRYCRTITVSLLDFPFFFLRLSVLCVFGHVDSILFLLKNFFVIITFFHFNVTTELLHRREATLGFSPETPAVDPEPPLVRDRLSYSSQQYLPEVAVVSNGYAAGTYNRDSYGGGGDLSHMLSTRNKKRKSLGSDLYQQPNGELMNTEATQLPDNQQDYDPSVVYTANPVINEPNYDDVPIEDDNNSSNGLPSPPGSDVGLQLQPADGAASVVSNSTRNAVNELDQVNLNEDLTRTSLTSSEDEDEQL